jgi:hypothetical protein
LVKHEEPSFFATPPLHVQSHARNSARPFAKEMVAISSPIAPDCLF